MIWNLLALAFGGACLVVWLMGARALWPLGDWRERALTARSFAKAIECRAPQRDGAAEERERLVRLTAEAAGLRPASTARLRLAATLADVGYAAVPYDILLGDAEGRAETAVLARHAEIGSAMIELVPGAEAVAPLVRLESGTPELKREADVLAAASAYVQTSRRQGADAALDCLTAGSGTLYNEAAVRSVLAVVDVRGRA